MSQRDLILPSGDAGKLVDATSGNETIPLPRGFATGRKFVIRRTDSSVNTATVTVPSGEYLDGVLNGTFTVGTDTERTAILKDPGQWESFGGMDPVALRPYFSPKNLPAAAGTGRAGWIDPVTGCYIASFEPIAAWQQTVSRAANGIAFAHWYNLGDSIIKYSNSYGGTGTDWLRKYLRAQYNMACLSGMLFMADRTDARVTYSVGTSANWAPQAGYGPVGASAWKAANGTARMRITFTEDDPFDQIAVHLFKSNTSASNVITSTDGGSESTYTGTPPRPYWTHVVTCGSGMNTTHYIDIGMSSSTDFVVAVEPRRSDNKFISVTRGGIGGAQTSDYLRSDSGWEVYAGGGGLPNAFIPLVGLPHLLMIELGVNDYLIPDGSHVQTPLATFKSNIETLAAWATGTGSIVQLFTQVPNQQFGPIGTNNLLQSQYVQAMYELVDAHPTNFILTDLFSDWVSYTARGGTGSGAYSDGTHPAAQMQPWMGRVMGRIARR